MTPTKSDEPPPKRRRREATLYDAAAGRVQVRGFITSQQSPRTNASFNERTRVSTRPVPPEEVLFRRKEAPERYEEDDIYFQDRHLPRSGEELPGGELLKAVHAYVSDFYGGLARDGVDVRRDWGSLDGTALLAMGVLLEEVCGEQLGERGHLALLEDNAPRDEAAEGDGGELVWNGRAWVESVLQHPRKRFTSTQSDTEPEMSQAESGSPDG